MGFWRDLGYYLRRLITLDAAQEATVGVTFILLVLGIFLPRLAHGVDSLSPAWAFAIFLAVLMFSGFRLWRDERRIDEREEVQLKEIAKTLRDQINLQETQRYRNFTYAENSDDRAHHQRTFLKNFPNKARAIDGWLNNPAEQDSELALLTAVAQGKIPERIPEQMRSSLALIIRSYVERTRLQSSPPAGWFEARTGDYGHNGQEVTCLAVNDGPSSGSIYTNVLGLGEVGQIAIELNALSMQVWQMPQAQTYRETARKDWRLREELRDDLTAIIHSNHLTRKNCDRECYKSPF